jgi:hypothetical protein
MDQILLIAIFLLVKLNAKYNHTPLLKAKVIKMFQMALFKLKKDHHSL